MSKRIVLLGSTGSIGTQALDVVHRCDYTVEGLCALRNIDRLEEQIRQFRPAVAAVQEEAAALELKRRLQGFPTEILAGEEGILAVAARNADITLNAIVGIAGLRPTLTALEQGQNLALANKESLVTGGDLVLVLAQQKGCTIHPVDSEHSAIFQCLLAAPSHRTCKKILLTASGGPFFGRTREELQDVTVEETLQHPNWNMGAKITVDSATMMNKGLEVIEAVHLFGLPQERIEVVVHRESIIHSMVEFDDNAILAQLSVPDMRIPIQYALTYPDRIASPAKELSFSQLGSMSFFAPDNEAFPCLSACREAIRRGGLYPAAVNGANEEAVSAFLRKEIGFNHIGELVLRTLEDEYPTRFDSVEEVFEADQRARAHVLQRRKSLY